MFPEAGLSKGRELTGLKQKVSALENQLTHVRERIEKLRSAAPTRKAQAYERGNVVVDPLRCTGCGMCEAICPVGAIRVTYVARVNSGRCTGCGVCVQKCPYGALSPGSAS